jgi:hypothetical protein
MNLTVEFCDAPAPYPELLSSGNGDVPHWDGKDLDYSDQPELSSLIFAFNLSEFLVSLSH